jgi:hypothetical protein
LMWILNFNFSSIVIGNKTVRHQYISTIQIENVQRGATKLVKNIQHPSYSYRSRYLGLPSLQYRRLRSDMVETFRINLISRSFQCEFSWFLNPFTVFDSISFVGKLFQVSTRETVFSNISSTMLLVDFMTIYKSIGKIELTWTIPLLSILDQSEFTFKPIITIWQ